MMFTSVHASSHKRSNFLVEVRVVDTSVHDGVGLRESIIEGTWYRSACKNYILLEGERDITAIGVKPGDFLAAVSMARKKNLRGALQLVATIGVKNAIRPVQ